MIPQRDRYAIPPQICNPDSILPGVAHSFVAGQGCLLPPASCNRPELRHLIPARTPRQFRRLPTAQTQVTLRHWPRSSNGRLISNMVPQVQIHSASSTSVLPCAARPSNL